MVTDIELHACFRRISTVVLALLCCNVCIVVVADGIPENSLFYEMTSDSGPLPVLSTVMNGSGVITKTDMPQMGLQDESVPNVKPTAAEAAG